MLALSACGGGGGGSQPPVANQGCDAATCCTLMVGLTDADGDFLSYSVDVVSLSLTKANGTVVQALPTRQRVDLTELVTAATIPNGATSRNSQKWANADIFRAVPTHHSDYFGIDEGGGHLANAA